MNKSLLILISICLCTLSRAQLQLGFELGGMQSLSRFDDSGDTANSMDPAKSYTYSVQYHLKYRLNERWSVGLHAMYQNQASKVVYNQEYFDNAKIDGSVPYYGRFSATPMSSRFNIERYFMAGPEISFYQRLFQKLEIELSASALIYDNRQAIEATVGLKQQDAYNYDHEDWHNFIYLYKNETEFLNGWNTKLNAAFRINYLPKANTIHRFHLTVSAGRSIRQNYAVQFRTNQPNTYTGSNVIKVSNYGAYWGSSIGYTMTLDYKRLKEKYGKK